LMGGLAEVPAIPQTIRDTWRKFAGDLHAELAKRDPASAARLNPSDRQRLIRAIEVFEATSHSLNHWQTLAQKSAFLNENNTERLFVNVEREVLYTRAERRFDLMMEQGALDEAKALPPLPSAKPIMKAIGVPELLSHLRGELSREDAITKSKTATRNYIKRQLTWWRGQMKNWDTVSPAKM
jgi:tRNA dimethylallyltransferase